MILIRVFAGFIVIYLYKNRLCELKDKLEPLRKNYSEFIKYNDQFLN